MFTLFKFLLTFVASFFILTIPVGEQPLFDTLHKIVRPYQKPAFSVIKKTLKFGLENSEKAFNNTKPKADHVRKVDSSTQKEEVFHDTYTEEEKDFLIRVLKGQQE